MGEATTGGGDADGERVGAPRQRLTQAGHDGDVETLPHVLADVGGGRVESITATMTSRP